MLRLKFTLLTVGIVAAAALMVVAWVGARNRGLQTHCRNNLRFLGELTKSLLEELPLNPYWPESEAIQKGQAKGRQFWLLLNKKKLMNKARELSPYLCPFHSEAPLVENVSLTADMIDYRGPSGNPLEFAEETAIGCDRLENHPDGSLNALVLGIQVKKKKRREEEFIEGVNVTIQIIELHRGDPRIERFLATTSD